MGIPRRGKDKENPVYKALQMGNIPSKVLLDKAAESATPLNERTNERTNERYSWEFEKLTATGRFGKPLRKPSVHECSSDKVVNHSDRNPKQIKHTTGKSSERGTDRASAEEGEYP